MERITARGGGFRGVPLCCAVSSAEPTWIELAGYRVLPAIEGHSLDVASYDPDAEAAMRTFMNTKP